MNKLLMKRQIFVALESISGRKIHFAFHMDFLFLLINTSAHQTSYKHHHNYWENNDAETDYWC